MPPLSQLRGRCQLVRLQGATRSRVAASNRDSGSGSGSGSSNFSSLVVAIVHSSEVHGLLGTYRILVVRYYLWQTTPRIEISIEMIDCHYRYNIVFAGLARPANHTQNLLTVIFTLIICSQMQR